MVRAFSLRLTNLKQEFKLLGSIIVLFLLDAAVDHAVERLQEGLVVLGGPLVRLVGCLILSLQAALIPRLSLVTCVLWLQYDGHVKELKCLGKNLLLAAAETGEDARYIENEI